MSRGQPHLVGRQRLGPSARLPPRACGPEPRHRALPDQLALELRERAEDVELQLAGRVGGVDRFDLLRSARDQLVAAGLRGVVVMDLSDCLEDTGLRRFAPTSGEPPYEELKLGFQEFRDR